MKQNLTNLVTIFKNIETKTPILVNIILDTVLDTRKVAAGTFERNLLTLLFNHKIAEMSENSKSFTKNVLACGSVGRDYLYTILNHWVDAYEKDALAGMVPQHCQRVGFDCAMSVKFGDLIIPG